MSMSEPSWKCNEDAENYAKFKEDKQVYQLCMALTYDFESVYSSLFHKEPSPSPSPSVDVVILQIFSGETNLATLKSQRSTHTSDILAAGVSTSSTVPTSPSSMTFKKNVCRYCKKLGHLITECYNLQSKQAAVSSH
ncbi:Zinc finger CCHC-type protein [Dioscorea alata]|uniref:Zinc finger CCHC-type protein n=1 Tax=Dioscorea alata TaxID=55571 RepID=A0ACB7W1W3_DIOAL|nr:Zinc finger CCHC-type protein [Dioscorea alata]